MDLSKEQVSPLDYFQGCKILSSNPFKVAWHFQYRAEVSFQEIILISSGPLSDAKCYAIGVEFYVRGSPFIQFLMGLEFIQ